MNASTYGAAKTDASFRAVQRLLLQGIPGARPLDDDGLALEQRAAAVEPPRTVAARVIEGSVLRARPVLGAPAAAFAAFLDGTQRSRVLHYHDGLPIVHGTVAAVVRVRIARRLVTWRKPAVESAAYAPCAFLPPSVPALLRESGIAVVDTTRPDASGETPNRHPFTLLERAVHMVQEARERVERTLAERWCDGESAPLFIDGGLSGSERVASSSCTVGIVKSHRTLYADGDVLATVLGLACGERSSVFRLTPLRRAPVASWYLRVRARGGHDPLWGLVRVEAAETDRMTERADEVSRWVLAETAPLSLPDGRWDKMAYGIRDCEEFLKAIC